MPLREVFNFDVESQILYHAPLSFLPSPASKIHLETGGSSIGSDIRGTLISEEEMKIFVNSESWSLGAF